MGPFRRILTVVLDGVGAGALPDAEDFGDAGADTLAHVVGAGPLDLPHLASMGLGRLVPLPAPPQGVRGAFGRLVERSPGKDTTTGHWELMGLPLDRPFPLFPEGFPAEVITPFEDRIGRKVLWNRPASGTEIIHRLGAEHCDTGKPIVYTSADSVFQIAAHEAVIPVEALYAMCREARALLRGPFAVSRVIARPFEGERGAFRRTAQRRDFSLPPPGDTVLDRLKEAAFEVVGVGKIDDIFADRGLTAAHHTGDNAASMEALLAVAERDFEGVCLANLIDFDMLYGHRRDVEGFRRALEAFDRALPEIRRRLGDGDLLVLTADHGNDPLHEGTDHTREYVPVLAWTPGFDGEVGLGDGEMADLGATIADIGEEFSRRGQTGRGDRERYA
ncbi:MAG: phosphopentomutase [Planctomycetota bacterium]|jgi:phosphopentomutase